MTNAAEPATPSDGASAAQLVFLSQKIDHLQASSTAQVASLRELLEVKILSANASIRHLPWVIGSGCAVISLVVGGLWIDVRGVRGEISTVNTTINDFKQWSDDIKPTFDTLQTTVRRLEDTTAKLEANVDPYLTTKSQLAAIEAVLKSIDEKLKGTTAPNPDSK